jgi:hypothetical protein
MTTFNPADKVVLERREAELLRTLEQLRWKLLEVSVDIDTLSERRNKFALIRGETEDTLKKTRAALQAMALLEKEREFPADGSKVDFGPDGVAVESDAWSRLGVGGLRQERGT